MQSILYCINVVIIEIKRLWKVKIKYPLEAITELLSLLGVFVLLSFLQGVSSIEGVDIIFGLLMIFSLPSLQGPHRFITGEKEAISQEGVFMLPLKAPILALLKDISVGILSLPQLLLVFFVSGKIIAIPDLKMDLFLVMVSLKMGTLGIGLVFAGLTLIAKRIGSLVNVFSILMLASTFLTSALKLDFLKYFSLYSYSFSYLSNTSTCFADLIGMMILSATYFIFGAIVFTIFENLAKKLGVLGR